MSKIRILTIVVIILSISNAFLLFAFIMAPPPPGTMIKHNIIKKLDFSGEQVEAFESLIEDHASEIKALEKTMQESRKNLYAALIDQDTPNEADLRKIGKTVMEIEKINFQHFLDIKEICNDDQMPKFEDLIKNFHQIFNKHRHPPKKP